MAGDRGFTLLEVMVAFIIAALALGVLFNSAGASLVATTVAGRYDEALSRAQSHLDTVGSGVALRPATQRGDEGNGFQWEIVIRQSAVAPSRPPGADGTRLPPFALYSVEAIETWQESGGKRQVRLTTRRIGQEQP